MTFDEREQFLLLDEEFKDDTLLADLTASVGLGGVELTSVTTYIDRDILVSRDASALTGSVSVDLGFPTAGVLLPSNLRRHHRPQDLHPGVAARLDRRRARSSGWSAPSIRTSTASTRSACRRRATTPSPTRRFGAGTSVGGRQRLPAQLALQCRPALRHQAEGAVRRGELRPHRRADRDRRRCAITTSRKSAASRRAASSPTATTRPTRPSPTASRRGCCSATRPPTTSPSTLQASKGFRLGGVNDPLNLGAVQRPGRGRSSAASTTYDDETLWNYEAGVKSQFGGDHLQRRRLLHRHQEPAGHRRRRLLLVARRVQRRRAHDGPRVRARRAAGRRASTCRSPAAGSKPSSTRPG